MAEIKDPINRERVLEAIGAIKLRVEGQTNENNSIKSLVQIVDFSRLASSNTHIINGRNGTGKTHVLKAFQQHCLNNYNDDKIFPAYIDCRDLDLAIPLSTISASDLIRRFYQNFLSKIIDSLESFVAKDLSISWREKLRDKSSARRKTNIHASIEQLQALLNQKRIEEALEMDQYNRFVTVSRDEGSAIKGGINLGGQASNTTLKSDLGANISASASKAENEKETTNLVFKGMEVISYEGIRTELEKLINDCEVNMLVILVDEWNSVHLSIQPLLAEMIKKTIGTSNKISLKIATLRYYTKTSTLRADNTRQRIGWLPGIDITTLADLDSLLNYDAYQQGVNDFLTHVAYQHTCLELPALKASIVNVKDFEHYLCNELFETPVVYSEAVRASEGNPRDFLSILSLCCEIAKISEKKISLEQVMRSVSTHFKESKGNYIAEITGGSDLYINIFNEIVQKRSKLFLFSKYKAENNEKLRELWHFRSIHLVNDSLMYLDENSVPHEYMVYSMDYGRLLALKADVEGANILNKMVTTLNYLPEVLGDMSSSGRMILTQLAISPKTGEQSISTQLMLNANKRAVINEIGIARVAKAGGVETSNTHDINYLVKNCVLDRLLD